VNDCANGLRRRYAFSDFLYYTCLLAVPVITAALAIGRDSLWWLGGFAVLAVGAVVLVLKYYCTRCPHYARNEKRLRCMFFWNLPKSFPPRPGDLGTRDRLVAWVSPVVVLALPLIWLIKEPGLLAVYGLSLVGFAATVRRHECGRCIYFACPMNKVPAETRPRAGVASGSEKADDCQTPL
jgi:hypothetical protein